MKTENELKEIVKEKYAAIANQSKIQNSSSCCGATCCSTDEVYTIMSEEYTHLEGYHEDADLGLGCGLPTEFARISEGDTVIDLGSGAGNDAFIARKIVSESGKVIGIDFTEAMISKAKENAAKLNFKNVEFLLGDIDNMPVDDNVADVIVSNCVLNLVPDKQKVFAEILRVLKPTGHFSISDIVLEAELPAKWKEVASLYAGCVSGAILKNDYLQIIQDAGFYNITVQKEKPILIPDNILASYLSTAEVIAYKQQHTNIVSITVYGEKQPGNI